ncbi:MAG TPA: 1,2-phenylacetyl-CoA epoxidase subunit PaaD [Candidatus Limnocylindrales bacterium]|nr:1,2-phenylacetyl-CoA epoxidase subunit PaaD [Candidatus Limnocylindrales bacterium]
MTIVSGPRAPRPASAAPTPTANATATAVAEPRLEDIWSVLAAIADPEIPALSIVDLGMIGYIDHGPGRLRVELLPTFVGCPAVELIRGAMEARLAPLAADVEVVVSFEPPWTSDRITSAGRERLRRSGFAPPPSSASRAAGLPDLIQLTAAPACPYCGSSRTRLESPFGPTPCRAVATCLACRQPFEAFKAI